MLWIQQWIYFSALQLDGCSIAVPAPPVLVCHMEFASHDQTDTIELWWQTTSLGSTRIFHCWRFSQGIWCQWPASADVSEMHQNEHIRLVSAPPRTHVVREYRDYVGVVQPQALRFLTHRDHSIWKATAASCFLRVTSSISPSNEQSLRVFHHCSTSGVFLLRCGVPMVVAKVDPLPRFSLGSNVASARSIRMIRNSE